MRLCQATLKMSAEINVLPAKTPRPAKFSATVFIARVNRWIVVWQLLKRRRIFADLGWSSYLFRRIGDLGPAFNSKMVYILLASLDIFLRRPAASVYPGWDPLQSASTWHSRPAIALAAEGHWRPMERCLANPHVFKLWIFARFLYFTVDRLFGRRSFPFFVNF